MARLLILDDSAVVLSVLETALSVRGHEVLTRTQAFGFSRVVLRQRPDAILVDLQMPILSGIQVAELLAEHESTKHVPVILFSARTPEQLEDAAAQCGAAGWIERGSSALAFADAVERLLGRICPEVMDRPARPDPAE